MRKTALLFLILFTVSTAAAQVDNIYFEEIPSTANTGENLDFVMSSDGAALDRVILQSRSPGEPGFTDRREKICTNYYSCDWSFEHTENNARAYEYRFRVQTTNGGGESSRSQTVTYYEDRDYYVEWVDEPPSTASRNSQVSMSVSAYDSAGRLDREGVLHIQYRDDSGDWITFDRRDCSNTNNDNRCSNQGSTSLTSGKIQDGAAHFRGRLEFESDSPAVSTVKTTSIRGEDGNVDNVEIGNLPSEAEEGSSFDIYAEADGENLQRLYIQERDTGEPGWTDWRSISCGGNDDCSFTRSYDVEDTGEKDFRAYAEATGDSDHSGIETVDFIQRTFYRIDEVILDSLPDTAEVDTNIDVTGEAEGRNLDRIILKTRSGFGGWDTETSGNCNGDFCEFDEEFSTSDAETLDFKLVARAGGKSRDSNIEVVTFIEDDAGRVDDVNIDNLPSDYSTDTDLEITGEAEGEDLDRIVLQKRDQNDDWERVATDSCGNRNSCDFSHTYQENNEQEVDFRLRAEAGEDSETSSIETVNFEDEVDDQIDFVDINNLPSQHPVDEALTIEGEAEGENLDEIMIQERDPGEPGWTDYRNKDCNNADSCSISRTYTSNQVDEKEFRIRVEAGEDADNSGTENVEFVEDEDIDSVSIDNLPNSHPVDQSLSISGSARGNELDEIAVEQRRQGSNNWNEIEDKDCNNSDSCSITASYTASQEETRNFRVRIDSNGETSYSSIETVDFFIQRRIDSISLQELPDTYPVNTDLNVQGSMTGQNLEELRIQTRTGFSGWTTVESKNCGESSSCSINRDFSTSQSDTIDFRLRGVAGSETLTSNIESVNFQAAPSAEVDSVNIGNLPSEQETGSSVTVTGSATGTDLENITIEYSEEGQTSWTTLEDDNCSGSSCQISSDYSTPSEQDVDFRVKAWAGNDRGYSSIRTVSFVDAPQPDQPSVDSVNLGNLPDRQNIETGLTVSASATGTELDELRIQVRNISESGWTTINTENCNNSDSCSTNTVYSSSSIGEKVFRAQGIAGSETENSQEQTVDFFIEGEVFSIQIDNLPSNYPVNTDLSITGFAQGSNLNQIILQRRRGFAGDWENVESTSCNSGSSCNFNADYRSSQTATFDFRLIAVANGERRSSGVETVSFQQPDIEDLIDSVDLEAPSSAQVGDEILLNGSATGEVDTLIIERRFDGGWIQVDSTSCSSTSCELTAEFTGNNAGTETFRTRAVAGGNSLTSEEESVTFSETPGITDVDIDNLPGTYPVDEELTISGSAEGVDLTEIQIQDKESSSDTWNTVRSESCNLSTSCSIEDTVEEFDPTTRDYRIVAFTANNNATSGTETVTYYEPSTTGDPDVSAVTIDNLPNTHPVEDELEIEAEASGNQLDSLRIQKREGFTGWEEVETENCRQEDSCSIDIDFEADEAITIDFRARAEAGTETMFSNIESVRFIDDIDVEDAQLRVLVEDEDDDELDDARVRVRNGDTRTRYTDDDGETNFDLEPGDYEIRVSKDGYDPEERDVELDEGDRRTERFTLEEDEDFDPDDQIRITSLDYDTEICRGDDLAVNVQISNYGDDDETVSVSGSGLGSTGTQTVEVDEDEVEEVEIIFENIRNTGERSFTVRIENGDTDRRTGTVDVSSCDEIGEDDRDSGVPTGLSARLDPRTVIVGETARIYGDVQGVRSPVDVRIRSDNFDRTVSSTRSGNYQAFMTPQQPGTMNFRISSGGLSTTRTLEVLPRASIEMIDAPRKVFEGEEFEICATVDSSVEARILLEEDGDVIRSVNDNGEVCFDVEAGSEGEVTYEFRALTSGTGSSAVRKVEILEAGSEFDTFPGQIATVETEPGQAKVDIYNTRESVTEYTVSVENINDRWVSQTERTVVLPKGEQETVYFYFSSREEGRFNPTINVEIDEETVFEREITLESIDAEQKGKKGFLARLKTSIGL